MDIKASAKYIRISPKKVRLVADVVRGMKTDKALDQLKFVNKRSAPVVAKLINSAIANAENNYELDKNNLFIKEIRVDESLTMKRWMPRAYGRATRINKRMSHINIVLGEIKDSGVVEAKKQETEKPVSLEEMSKKAEGGEKKQDKDNKDKEAKSKEDTSGKSKNASKKGFAGKMFQRKSG